MPIVALPEKHFLDKLGKKYDENEMTELCFDYGLELDDITSEKEIMAKEQGAAKAVDCSSDLIYKIEVPANRYDLLCTEGLTRALQIFHSKLTTPSYTLTKPKEPVKVVVKPPTQTVRPFVVAAILRNVQLDQDRYDSLIDLQEKLHQNICRKRSLVAIGTHDLDALKPPFIYTAEKPEDIRFAPLNKTEEYSADQLIQLYSTDSHLKAYLPLIADKLEYPVIRDSTGAVASMPPIINGNLSRVKLSTRNIFIECTATDLTKATIVLDTLVCMFSEYCQVPFTVEPVEVVQADGSCHIFPKLETRTEVVSVDYVNCLLGTHLSSDVMCNLLQRMGLNSEASTTGDGLLTVRIPPTRHDILHACDVAEDVAIAYGFNNIEEKLPQTYCIAQSQPINRLTNLLRPEIAQAGFVEALSFSLCSRDDISVKLRRKLESTGAVHISNPKTLDFQVVRTSLLPGLLHTLVTNKSMPLPLKLFEVQDVVLKDESVDVGCRNERHLCAVYYNRSSGFEVIHGLLDRVMRLLSVQVGKSERAEAPAYRIEAANEPTFFPGRCARVLLSPGDKVVGHFGTLHPEVIRHFDLNMPCSALEINIAHFL